MIRCRIQSTPKKKMAVITTMIPTITEVIQVSFQLVQVTLRAFDADLAQELHRVLRFFDRSLGGAALAVDGRGGAATEVRRGDDLILGHGGLQLSFMDGRR